MAKRAWNAGGSDRPAYQPADLVVRDWIVCDWRMPHTTGIELLEQGRGNDPARPFIAKPYAPEQLESKLVALARRL